MKFNTTSHCNTLQNIATHCNALQYTAACCDMLQQTCKHCNNALRHAGSAVLNRDDGGATMMIFKMQHTATHRNALQHAETHRNTQVKQCWDALMESQRRASDAEKAFIATKLKEEVDHQLVKDVTEQVCVHIYMYILGCVYI